MAIYIYRISDGALVSWCPNDTDPIADPQILAARGFASSSGLPVLDSTHAWDSATHSVITVTAPTPANVVNTFDFIMAFTATELAAIRASNDNNVQQFLYALQVTQGVNLNATTITNALQYLVGHALLTAQRANEIGATIKGTIATGML